MKFLPRMRAMLAWCLKRRAQEEALDEELETYIAFTAAEKQRLGLSPSEARRLALAEAGVEHVKERVRTERPGGKLSLLLQDVRHAARLLRTDPLFAVTSIILVAASIGLACAAFAMVDSLVLKTLPVPEPDRLLLINGIGPNGRIVPVASMLEPIQKVSQDRAQIFGFRSISLQGTVGQAARMVQTYGVAGDYFEALGGQPQFGRMFDSTERSLVAVISHGFWRNEFGSDANVLGKTVTLGTTQLEVIGVARPEFVGTNSFVNWDVILPVDALHVVMAAPPARRDSLPVEMGVRLNPGITREAYVTYLEAAWPTVIQASVPPGTAPEVWRERLGSKIRVDSLSHGLEYAFNIQPTIPRAITMTFSLSILIFCVACLSLALLAIARGVRHQRQTAIRLAIGGSLWRVMRPYVVESFLLSAIGCVAGLLIAHWWSALGTTFLPSSYSTQWGVSINRDVIGVAALMALMTSLIGSLLAGLLTSRCSLLSSLGRGGSMSQSHVRLRAVLLTLQLATSLILVQYALLYLKDLSHVSQVDIGFDIEDLHVYTLVGKLPSRPLPPDYFESLTSEFRALPGVTAAAISGTAPPLSYLRDNSVPVTTDDGQQARARVICVFPGFFDTIKLPVLGGRDFSPTDRTSAIITENLARNLYTAYPAVSPLGHTIRSGEGKPLQMVGVVRNVTYTGQRLGEAPVMFMPCMQSTNPWQSSALINVFIRSERSLQEIAPEVKTIATRSSYLIFNMRDQKEIVAASLQQERMLATVSGIFGGLIILLTGVGLYAFCNYLFALRTRELAIRAALGASPNTIVKVLMREIAWILLAGAAIGIAATLAGRHLIDSLVSSMVLTSAWNVFLGLLIIVLVTLAAALTPAIRAIRLDVARALRSEG